MQILRVAGMVFMVQETKYGVFMLGVFLAQGKLLLLNLSFHYVDTRSLVMSLELP